MKVNLLRRCAVVMTTALTLGATPLVVGTALAYNPDCGKWYFDGLSTKTNMIGQVGNAQSSYFGNGGTQSFSAGYTGSVGESVSAGVEVSAKAAMFAEVKASVNSTLSTSQSVSITHTVTQPVPKGYWGNGRYGRYRTVVTGHSYHLTTTCVVDIDHGRVTYYASGSNMAEGWCMWVSTTSLGSQPQQCNPNHPYVS